MIYNIVDGYIELLTTGNGEKISVTTLCSSCRIHRSSFYRYFEDIQDLDDKFLSVLYASRDCAKDFRPRSMSEMIDYLVSIVLVMKNYESLFRKSEKLPHLLKYRDRWSSIVCDDFLPWWPRNRYSYRHPLLDARLSFSVGIIDTFLDYALTSPTENIRAISFILIEYMTGGRLRVIEKSQYIDLEIDRAVDKIYQEEIEILKASNRKAAKNFINKR